ncbi:hypothetical protein MMU07_04580 [Aquiflexum sp. LQ15W]|uniref:hypothetical protein n=1 Tax=Cognataquiflexum nitidum TaxID=2922272 RepID=UPI001F136854|nr:hypothetical protein [Cognataquiflexum nitidum]MCH6198840.1 hypothetical protein [Cognataquiflexum nitidum]
MRDREDIGTHGLQNVAANFAYDKEQAFFKKPIAIHGAAFMMGGIGASLQQGIMKGKSFESDFLTFGKKFGLSTLAYGAEYSLNYYFKTKMQYVKYGDYRRNKAWSFGIKSLAFGWLYSL